MVLAFLLLPAVAACSSNVPEGEISAKDLEWVKEQALWRDLTPIEGAPIVKGDYDWIGLPVKMGATCSAVFNIRLSGSVASIDVTDKNGVLIAEYANPFMFRDNPELMAKCE